MSAGGHGGDGGCAWPPKMAPVACCSMKARSLHTKE